MKKGKPIVLNGVGLAYLTRIVDGKPETVRCGTLQDMKISFTASDSDVYGGDSPMPIYTISKDQTITVSATEATFSLEYLALTNGATMTNGGELFFSQPATLIATGNTFTVPGNRTTILPETVIVTVSDDADGLTNVKSLVYTSGATPATGKFNITKSGVMTFADGDVAGKYVTVDGIYTDTDSRKAEITTSSFPQFIEIRHISNPVDMGDGVKVRYHTHIFRARSTGKFDIDHKRQEAHAVDLEFKVLYDPQRSDTKVMTITEEEIKEG